MYYCGIYIGKWRHVVLIMDAQGEVDQAITALMLKLPQHITTIPGVGLVTGAMIRGEIGDIQRFPEPERLVAYAGLDPVDFQSRQFQGDRTLMSNRVLTPYAMRSAPRRRDPSLGSG